MSYSWKEYRRLFDMEEEVLSFWAEDKTFEKSLRKRKGQKIFSFYDGPPFITGTPHYATLLPSIAKDIIPRFQTMKGYFVRRRWGWDVHGLPIENQVEKSLGIKNKRQVESLGIDKFVEACRQYVNVGTEQWRWYIHHIGRWADIDNAYRTDSLEFMESVIWAFKQLYEKGLIYRGKRVSLYCTRCATPLSKFEVTMDDDSYKLVDDPFVTIKFKMTDEDTFILAWTTTPWTLPANLALAVKPDAQYLKVAKDGQTFIMAKEAFESHQKEGFQVLESLSASKLLGKKYCPLYRFFSDFQENDNDYSIVGADFVAPAEGTGIVHIAPGFGEEDTALGEKIGLSMLDTVDDEGCFVEAVKPWAGRYVKDADPEIIEDLKKRGLLFSQGVISHSYPHCHRCGTPLIYKAQESWYLDVEPLKEQMLKNNKFINWVPSHFGDGRFAFNIANAPHWCISRSRYWGTPVPVWVTEDGKDLVVGSLKELEELSGQKITDLHRPYIDNVTLTTPEGKKAYRVKEVLDGWFESGSMPYAQDHYPFENEKLFKDHYPCDFIIEYTGQLRGWFYYLHLLGNALFDRNSFTQVAVTGVLMGTDGKKMSKSAGNYPDPRNSIEKYGAEALRLYFMGSKIMAGEDTSINEAEIAEESRLLNILHNTVKYFVTYANLYQFKDKGQSRSVQSDHILDHWIQLRARELIYRIDKSLESLDFPGATKVIRPFVEDLSTWYLRRSRERFVQGESAAFSTMHWVLETFALAAAPILPFSAERIWRALKHQESVHLQDYPQSLPIESKEDVQLLEMMKWIREIASTCHMLRAGAKINLRYPLNKLVIQGQDDVAQHKQLICLLQEEVNVKSVEFGQVDKSLSTAVVDNKTIGLDVALTDQLREEGILREIIRLIQQSRKQAKLEVGQTAKLYYWSDDPLINRVFANNDKQIKKIAYLSQIDRSSDAEQTNFSGDLKLKLEIEQQ